jgi:hypothetical protein
MRYNNRLIYITRAVDWKGQANSIGEIEPGPPPPIQVPPPACSFAPIICQMYQELFDRLPDPGGADFWLAWMSQNNKDQHNAADMEVMRNEMRSGAAPLDCAHIGGTFDYAGNRCIWR